MLLTAGTRVGSYQVVALLGAGGMGEVYRARDTKLDREVAIKVLPEAFASDPDRTARFAREAKTLAALNHPNIAAIYGIEESNGVSALVLELVEGPTLADRIARGPIPLAEALAIARQIADALEAAHEQGIVHRDLKPANIKIRPDSTVKVLDLGLAKALTNERLVSSGVLSNSPTITSPAGVTGAGVLLGTAAYMSPEQIRGKAADKRSDIWAFGCVLFEMLTGRRAFEGEEVSDTLAATLTKEPDWAKLPPDTPASVRRLLGRALEKDRKRRLADIADARVEVDDATVPMVVHPSTTTRVPLVWAAVALLVGTVVGAAVYWRVGPSPIIRTPIRRFTLVFPSNAPLMLTPSSRDLAISPDGTVIAYIAGPREQLFVRRLDRLDAFPLAPDLTNVRTPFFSPDGKWVGFAVSNELKKVSVDGGPVSSICRIAVAMRGATWALDDTIVFATTDSTAGLLQVSSSGGGTIRTLTHPDGNKGELDHYWPQILPGGEAVLFTIVPRGPIDSAQIAILNLRTGVTKTLLRGGTDGRYVAPGFLTYNATGTMRAIRFSLDRLDVVGAPIPVLEQVATTTDGGISAAVADDGTLVYADSVNSRVGESRRTLVWVDRAGNETDLNVQLRSYAVPRISPDGGRLAVHIQDPANTDVEIYDLDRKTWLRLTFDRTADIRPVWMPNGKSILFRSDLKGAGLYRKASDGSGDIERIGAVNGDGSPMSVSEDGKMLIFSAVDPTTGRDLWRLNLDDRKPEPLIVEMGNQGNATISPNGKWVAYQDETEGGLIYVRPFPNVTAATYQVAAGGSKWPSWSRDGRELFFVTGGALMSLNVDADGEVFRWTNVTKLFDAPYSAFSGITQPRNYDVSPNGQRFLVVKDVIDNPANLTTVVVENWPEELKRLVPAN